MLKIRFYPIGKKNPKIKGTLGVPSNDPWGINGSPYWFVAISRNFKYLRFQERELQGETEIQRIQGSEFEGKPNNLLQEFVFDLPERKMIDLDTSSINWIKESITTETLDLGEIRVFMFKRAIYLEVNEDTTNPNLIKLIRSIDTKKRNR